MTIRNRLGADTPSGTQSARPGSEACNEGKLFRLDDYFSSLLGLRQLMERDYLFSATVDLVFHLI